MIYLVAAVFILGFISYCKRYNTKWMWYYCWLCWSSFIILDQWAKTQCVCLFNVDWYILFVFIFMQHSVALRAHTHWIRRCGGYRTLLRQCGSVTSWFVCVPACCELKPFPHDGVAQRRERTTWLRSVPLPSSEFSVTAQCYNANVTW